MYKGIIFLFCWLRGHGLARRGSHGSKTRLQELFKASSLGLSEEEGGGDGVLKVFPSQIKYENELQLFD